MRPSEATAIALLCLALFLGVSTSKAEIVNEIVAVVNGEPITRYDLNTQMGGPLAQAEMPPQREGMEAEREKETLQFMIEQELFRQEAKELGISVSESQVEDRLETIRTRNNMSREEMEEYLLAQGMTMENFKSTIKEQIKINRLLSSMVQQKVVVTEEEMRRYYEENKDEFLDPAELELSLILMRDGEKLQDIRQEIEREEKDFSEAARDYSLGPGAEQGGYLGALQEEELDRGIREVVQDLESGELSQVFPLRGGYALLRLESRDYQDPSFSRVREEVHERIYSRKVEQRYEEYVSDLRSRALIEVRL